MKTSHRPAQGPGTAAIRSRGRRRFADLRGLAGLDLALLAALALTPASIANAGSPGGAAIDSDSPVPKFVDRRMNEAGEPLWVRADAAVGSDGTVDWGLLGDWAQKVFRGVADQPPVSDRVFELSPEMGGIVKKRNPDGTTTDWLVYGISSKETPVSRWMSAEALVGNVIAAYVGEVAGVEEGFLSGDVGSLLTVHVKKVLKESKKYKVRSQLYMYYPEAKFSIGDLNFYKKYPLYPPRLAVGDRIVVAADRFPPDSGRVTVLLHPDGIIIESKEGLRTAEESVMKALVPSSSRFEEVKAELRDLLKKPLPAGAPSGGSASHWYERAPQTRRAVPHS